MLLVSHFCDRLVFTFGGKRIFGDFLFFVDMKGDYILNKIYRRLGECL